MSDPTGRALGYARRVRHEIAMWRHRQARRRHERAFDAWLQGLRDDPPDVLLGSHFAEFGGVRGHLLAIQRHSALRVALAPSPDLVERVPIGAIKGDLRGAFMASRIPGMRAVHSHVFPWFIEWCAGSGRGDALWVHTYHLPYFPEHAASGVLEPWQAKINEALTRDARHADVRLSVSRWQQEHLAAEHGVETDYLPNGVDVARCDAGDAARFARYAAPGSFLLYVGRNDPVKNPAEVVRLARQLPDVPVVMVGGGLSPETLAAEAGDPLPDNVTVLGPLPHTAVQDALAACAAVVVTSKREGLPTLVLEAMAHGKPVVVSDEPGCVEAVDGGAYGFVYRLGDLDDLVDQTRSALDDDQRCAGARARVLEEYDWRVVVPTLDAIYTRA